MLRTDEGVTGRTDREIKASQKEKEASQKQNDASNKENNNPFSTGINFTVGKNAQFILWFTTLVRWEGILSL